MYCNNKPDRRADQLVQAEIRRRNYHLALLNLLEAVVGADLTASRREASGRRARGLAVHLVMRTGLGLVLRRCRLVVLVVFREGKRGVRAGDALLSSSAGASPTRGSPAAPAAAAPSAAAGGGGGWPARWTAGPRKWRPPPPCARRTSPARVRSSRSGRLGSL